MGVNMIVTPLRYAAKGICAWRLLSIIRCLTLHNIWSTKHLLTVFAEEVMSCTRIDELSEEEWRVVHTDHCIFLCVFPFTMRYFTFGLNVYSGIKSRIILEEWEGTDWWSWQFLVLLFGIFTKYDSLFTFPWPYGSSTLISPISLGIAD